MSLIWAGLWVGGLVTAGYAWPDLVVTDIWRGSNAICYEIRNIGDTPAAPGYSVALMVESTIVGYDVVPIELAYRQKYSACYAVGWDCTMASDEVTAIVDAFWEVPELDEDNNVLMEVWSCVPVSITAGPEVYNITHEGALLEWSTNIESTSIVSYGLYPWVLDQVAQDSNFVTFHQIQLTGLLPYANYYFYVASLDTAGRLAQSATSSFITAPAPTESPTPTETPPPTPSETPSPTETPSPSVSPSPSPTETPWPTASPSPSFTPSPSPSESPTAPPTESPTPEPTLTPVSPTGPLPDLIVTDIVLEGATIRFQIRNIGDLNASGVILSELLVDRLESAFLPQSVELAPGQRQWGTFEYEWTCPERSHTVQVVADVVDELAESDESNNSRLEQWLCDQVPPHLVYGPAVSEVTATSAVVHWETSEETDGRVRFGRRAGDLNLEMVDSSVATVHSVLLTPLESNATYGFVVESADPSGNTVSSPRGLFRTLPEPDSVDPRVRLLEPAAYRGRVTIQAQATDDAGIGRVEFLLDGVVVFTDYASPYECPLDTRAYLNGPHSLRARAFDFSGRLVEDEQAIDIENVTNISGPQVTIQSPLDDATIHGSTPVVVRIQDDTGVADSVLYVDGEDYLRHGFTPPDPPAPVDTTVTFTLDASLVSNGTHSIAVRAWDPEGQDGVGLLRVVVDNPPPPPQPKLKLVEHSVQRQDHAFHVTITIENVGAGTASEIGVEDTLRGFQAISRVYTYPTPATSHASFSPTNWRGTVVVWSGQDLPPGGQQTFVYSAVPVLNYPQSPTPTIGDPVQFYYRGPDGMFHQDTLATWILASSDLVPLGQSYANATQQADYLLMTNPRRLYELYLASDVDGLLSDMAELALYEHGVLGYLDTQDAVMIDRLIEPYVSLGNPMLTGSGQWAIQMHPNFRTMGLGYLLIVGETEIVPSWTATDFTIGWNPVEYSDHPYADTGGTPAPDLNVGRIIGDSAAALRKPIQASLGVFRGDSGYSFDRDRALMIADDGRGAFETDIDQAKKILEPEFDVALMKWREYFQVGSFVLPYDSGDRVRVGDVLGDAFAEGIVADATQNTIRIVTYPNGSQVGSLATAFTAGDALAVGDLVGDGKAEILVGCHSTGCLAILSGSGTVLYSFYAGFAQEDALAAGNFLGLANDQVLMADSSTDFLYVFEIQSDGLGGYTHTPRETIDASFDAYDSLAAGDLLSCPRDEIAIGDVSLGKVFVRDCAAGTWSNFDLKLAVGDDLCVGNVFGLPKAQVLISVAADQIRTGYFNPAVNKWDIGDVPAKLKPSEGIAAGNVALLSGSPTDEIVLAGQDDTFRFLDPNNASKRIQAALPGLTRDRDLVYWSGHGNINVWGGAINSHEDPPSTYFPFDFRQHNPIILATSCLTGNYQTSPKEYRNIAESFLAKGAAVYMGSTQSTWGYTDRLRGQKMFSAWGPYETMGKIFTDLEASYWKGNQKDDWWFAVWEYNYYGDPKFGAAPPYLGTDSAATMGPQAIVPPPEIVTVNVPDFETTTVEGLEWVSIPGGEMWATPGDPWIPYYVAQYDLPAGYTVDNVVLLGRSEPVLIEGLEVSMTSLVIASCQCNPEPYSGTFEGFFPPGEFDWNVVDHPDGSRTLCVSVYAFRYSPLTAQALFSNSFTFALVYGESPMQVVGLATDRTVYAPGAVVGLEYSIQNSGDPRDVTLETVVRRYGPENLVDSLAMHFLGSLSGPASFSAAWDSQGHDAGLYLAEVTARGEDGRVLDRRTETFRIGLTAAQVDGLRAIPNPFKPGDSVRLQLTGENTGPAALSGTVVLRVQDAKGTTVHEYREDFVDIPPGGTIGALDFWDSTGMEPGSYTLIGLISYGDGASDPLAIPLRTVIDVNGWLSY